MKTIYRLCTVEEAVNEMELYDVPDDIMESEDGYQIIISGWWVYIPESGVNLHEGIFCCYDAQEKAYLPDSAVTVIKKAEGEETKEGDWLYYGQDGFVTTLADYLHGKMDREKQPEDDRGGEEEHPYSRA